MPIVFVIDRAVVVHPIRRPAPSLRLFDSPLLLIILPPFLASTFIDSATRTAKRALFRIAKVQITFAAISRISQSIYRYFAGGPKGKPASIAEYGLAIGGLPYVLGGDHCSLAIRELVNS